MTIETIFRTKFYQNGVSELAAKHIEDCTSGPISVLVKNRSFRHPKVFLKLYNVIM